MTAPNEEVIWKGASSQVVNFWVHLGCGLSSLLLIGVCVWLQDLWWLLGLLIVPLVVSLWKWLLVRSRRYELTTERLKVSEGVLSRRTDELELYRVRDTTVFEPFLYRLFNRGDIQLNTSDVSTPQITLRCVPGANALRDQLRQHIEACRDRKRARVSELTGSADGDVDEAHGR